MKRAIYFLLAALLLTGCGAQKQVIGFYNLENLFDTLHDEGKNDAQYLPDGQNEWTQEKYAAKLTNMASVIRAMRDANGQYHALLGVAEVENEHVLRDLVAQPSIADARYGIVHYESPDSRGIDVALLYRPDVFEVLESKPLPFDFNSDIEFDYSPEEQAAFRTRDILMVRGKLAGRMTAVFVAHLPSRLNGKGGDLRSRGAEIIYNEAMRLQRDYPGIKIAVMGDMNDDPTDESMLTWMHSAETVGEMAPDKFFSPFLSMIKNGYGTLEYRGAWNIFDIILVNDAFVHGKGPKIQKIEKDTYYGKVFKAPFMEEQEGEFKGTPFRTFSRGVFKNGYSDHYPTFIIVQ